MNKNERFSRRGSSVIRASRIAQWGLGLASLLALGVSARAQNDHTARINPILYSALRWRNVGPFHGGRVAAVAGVIGQPGVFYFGAPQGGIWKSTSAGVTWSPIFDRVKSVDSIGAIAVAPSDPRIIYAGTGDPIDIGYVGTLGDGVWKSTDAGRTWRHIGLDDTVKVDRILVDPANPNLVIVSALGDATHHGGGIYRSTNGGHTWVNTLKPAGYDGTREVEYAYDEPGIMLADTQGTIAYPFGPRSPRRTRSPLVFKSTDEGLTWRQIKIPPFTGRIAVAIAEQTHGQRIYIIGKDLENGSGLFRSDDGGISWRHMAGGDRRIQGSHGSYFAGVYVDSQNPDVVYTLDSAMYRSMDGGVTFREFMRVADYHKLWIDPSNGDRMILGSDKGASVTLDGGRTWSLWYAEPIAQIYDVATTGQYPYWIVGPQQDTGAVTISSRSNWGQVNITDWSPVPSFEFGTITPDPLRPNILYGVGFDPGGGGSDMIKINMHTGQWQNVAPNFGVDVSKYRQTYDAPKKFDTEFDPSALYAAYQCLLVSRNGAHSWKAFSPDLTTPKGAPLAPCGTTLSPPTGATGEKPQPSNPFLPAGAVLESFSISKTRRGVFWTVSSNRQIYRTIDGGKHWTNVSNITRTPPHTKFLTIEAGDDVNSAYVTARILVQPGLLTAAPAGEDADVPLIWRTTDGGKTWTRIVNGLPRDQRTGSWVNVLRADPGQPRLLFAGTETTVYVSFDDGDHWQSLHQNLPSTSIRDMTVHTRYDMNDLVICTYGRGFWVLDDIAPLRQIAANAEDIASSPVYFFKPENAIRAYIDTDSDQTLFLEVPHALNPPYGAVVDYYLRRKPSRPIELRVFDSHGDLLRTMSSESMPPSTGQAHPQELSTHVGLNRVTWNLRYAAPPVLEPDEALGPYGPDVIPGVYTLKLTVGAAVYTRHVMVTNDPRVGQSAKLMAGLRAQNRLTMLAYDGMERSYTGHQEVNAVEAELATLVQGKPPGEIAAQANTLETSLEEIGGSNQQDGIYALLMREGSQKPAALQSFLTLNTDYANLVSMIHYDMAPTPTRIATWEADCRNYNRTMDAWKAMQTRQLTYFNTLLTKTHLPGLALGSVKLESSPCRFGSGLN